MAQRHVGTGKGAGFAPALLLALFVLLLIGLVPERAAAAPENVAAADRKDGGVVFLSADPEVPIDRLLSIDPEDEPHVRPRFGAHVHLAFPLVAIMRAGFHASGGSVFAARAPPFPV